ncbi:MAG: hypothetical protein EXR69_12525 [Myxococcales bacterium]|nr:hypothetical protein [Myxococcales bacterium]
MPVFKAAEADLLTRLVAEQTAESSGQRNVELFRRTRVALEAGYDDSEVRDAMVAAGLASGLDRREVRSTVASAMDAPVERAKADSVASTVPSSEWKMLWASKWPRVIGVTGDKRPVQRWQYGWDEPNDPRRPGTYYAIVIPPGLAVLDIDDTEAFNELGLDIGDDAPRYRSISDKATKGHVWYRLHPDRPYPQKAVKPWAGADLLVGGMGIANIKSLDILDTIGAPCDLPFAPDWMQPKGSARIVNIVDYMATVPDTIPWVIDKVAFIHGLTILAGAPKAGKSTCAFEMMRCRETGELYLEQFVRPGPTLLVTEEGGVSVKFKGHALTQLDIYDRKASAGETFEDTLGVIAAWCADHPGGLVFIDTLAAWAQVEDENSAAEMQAALDGIRLAVSEPYEVAVVLIHHARKGGGKDGEAIRGSGAILAAVDHVMELKRGDDNQRKNRRRIEVMSRVLREFEQWTFDWDAESERGYLVDPDEAISDDLEDEVQLIPATGPGITAAESGMHWRKLNHLVNKGRVRQVRGAGRLPHLYWGIPPAAGIVGERRDVDDSDE